MVVFTNVCREIHRGFFVSAVQLRDVRLVRRSLSRGST